VAAGKKSLYEHYELGCKLGSGSFADVYQAVCKATGSAKAIKLIDPSSFKFGGLTVEIEVLQKCDHANVIRLEAVLEDSRGHTALVFPAFDMDLQRLIRLRRGFPQQAFPERQRLDIAHGMWRGVEYLHSIQVLHRDIKPANILVCFGSSVHAVVADMGYACHGRCSPSAVAGSADSELTAKVCTNAYVAPELLAVRIGIEKAVYGRAVDVWAAAVVSFEIASLHRFCTRPSTPEDQYSCIFYVDWASRRKVSMYRMRCESVLLRLRIPKSNSSKTCSIRRGGTLSGSAFDGMPATEFLQRMSSV
jgi:serine/threonine protein kinase